MSVHVLREVRLYGPLGRQFGRVHRLAVLTPAEAVQALCAVLPGFERAFLRGNGPTSRGGARYHVFVGRGARRTSIGLEEASEPVGYTEPIRIVPYIAGAKNGGFLKIVLGAALVFIAAPLIAGAAGLSMGAGLVLSSAAVGIGYSLMLGGVVQLLSPQRKAGNSTTPEKVPSYGFDGGPVNTTQQGLPVPVGFGRMIIGSAVISAGLSTDDLVLIEDEGDALEPEPLPSHAPRNPITDDPGWISPPGGA
jgi:predicted phage tail protein